MVACRQARLACCLYNSPLDIITCIIIVEYTIAEFLLLQPYIQFFLRRHTLKTRGWSFKYYTRNVTHNRTGQSFHYIFHYISSQLFSSFIKLFLQTFMIAFVMQEIVVPFFANALDSSCDSLFRRLWNVSVTIVICHKLMFTLQSTSRIL